MPKRTAVIDIGSNSARLVIYQRTSRYGFHLILQQKSRVRIGEGAYEKGGMLQPDGIRRAYGALHSFAHTIKEYKVHHIFCIATSALRDAPNKDKFISLIRQKLGLKIKVIDGRTEARYGAVAALNLLPVSTAVTIDIGGGSTDISLIVDGRIMDVYSLDIGTVRLKELFTDQGVGFEKMREYISKTLTQLPQNFRCNRAVGIGGSARTVAKAIIKKSNYPYDKIHAFEYDYLSNKDFIKSIIKADNKKLASYGIKPNRFDTIKEGTAILLLVLDYVGAKSVITSGAGVREGVYLSHLLRNNSLRFPHGINPSIRSIKDRFDFLSLPERGKKQVAKRLFRVLEYHFDGKEHHLKLLLDALSLSNIGKMLTIYKEHRHAFYIASQELNYGFTHQEMLMIALLLRSNSS